MTEQRDVSLMKCSLIGDEAAFSARFGQDHRLGYLAHLLQVFDPHFHEALALQADQCFHWQQRKSG